MSEKKTIFAVGSALVLLFIGIYFITSWTKAFSYWMWYEDLVKETVRAEIMLMREKPCQWTAPL